jgi:predicted RecA/RadA family phage recombinase
MATNEHLRHADHVSLPVPDGTKTGDPVRVGVLNGVAQTNPGEGGNKTGEATVWLDGSWNVPVKGAVDAGAAVYIADGALSGDGTDVFGAALTGQSADGTLPVKILQAVAGAPAGE